MKFPRFGFVAVLALLAGTMAAAAAPATTSSAVNVRNGPASDYRAIGTLARNEIVDVGQCTGGYCQIVGNTISGWVSSQYLVFAQGAPPRPAPGATWPQPGPQYPQPQRPGPQYPQPGPQYPQYPQPGPQYPQYPQPGPQYPQPPRPPIVAPAGEDAGACFYSERNFRGASFCLDQGETLNAFRTWDNRIRSVEVFGGASVDLCTLRDLYGACVTLRRDTERLPASIDARARSTEVY